MRCVWLAGLLVATVGAAAQTLPSADTPMSPGARFGADDGAALYAQSCAACHQPDGRGAVGAAAYPALAGNARLDSSDYVLSVMLYGLRSMPPVGRMMSDAQVAAVATYVRSRFGAIAGSPVTAEDAHAARP